MHRAFIAFVMASLAAVALAQTVNGFRGGADATPTQIPEIPAGTDPMDRKPDPAADSPAAKTLTQPAGSATGDAECHVQRADTDTGFVVVCEEQNGG